MGTFLALGNSFPVSCQLQLIGARCPAAASTGIAVMQRQWLFSLRQRHSHQTLAAGWGGTPDTAILAHLMQQWAPLVKCQPPLTSTCLHDINMRSFCLSCRWMLLLPRETSAAYCNKAFFQASQLCQTAGSVTWSRSGAPTSLRPSNTFSYHPVVSTGCASAGGRGHTLFVSHTKDS